MDLDYRITIFGSYDVCSDGTMITQNVIENPLPGIIIIYPSRLEVLEHRMGKPDRLYSMKDLNPDESRYLRNEYTLTVSLI